MACPTWAPNAPILKQVMQSMRHDFHHTNLSCCASWKMGKHPRLRFVTHEIAASKLVEIVYTDILGPSPYSSTKEDHIILFLFMHSLDSPASIL